MAHCPQATEADKMEPNMIYLFLIGGVIIAAISGITTHQFNKSTIGDLRTEIVKKDAHIAQIFAEQDKIIAERVGEALEAQAKEFEAKLAAERNHKEIAELKSLSSSIATFAAKISHGESDIITAIIDESEDAAKLIDQSSKELLLLTSSFLDEMKKQEDLILAGGDHSVENAELLLKDFEKARNVHSLCLAQAASPSPETTKLKTLDCYNVLIEGIATMKAKLESDPT